MRKTIKKLTLLLGGIFILGATSVNGQKVNKEYMDGQIYLKIKNEIPFVFDASQPTVDINSKLSFLLPLVEKYQIRKADASYYFSKSEILKRTFRIYFGNSGSVEQFLSDVNRLTQVEYAEQIPFNRTDFTPNDINPNSIGTSGGQYGLYNIHAKEAWDITKGSSSVVIAVVDNGVDIAHSDLAAIVSSSRDVSDLDNDPTPPTTNHVHGTHVSGIACATTNNSNGIASIGFGCSLMAVKATHNTTTNTGTVNDGYEGIAWAAANGADVINCSWGSYTSSTTNQAVIDDAFNNNAIVVSTAGNDNVSTTRFPAGYNHAVAVASVNISDVKTSGTTGSNFGSWVDVSAPGDNIRSTLPGNIYGSMSGTSMAAPLVAGLCGLVRSLNSSLSYDEVVNIVVSNADNINSLNTGFSGLLGSGRINAYNAALCARPCSAKIPKNLSASVFSNNVVFHWDAVSCVAGYTIQYRKKGIGSWTSVNVTTNSYAAALLHFTNYEFQVRSKCSSSPLAYSGFSSSKLFSTLRTGDQSGIDTEQQSLEIQLFPNPAANEISLKIESGKPMFNIQIVNIEGKTVLQKQMSNENEIFEKTIDISQLPAGMYMMRVSNETDISLKRFIKN